MSSLLVTMASGQNYNTAPSADVPLLPRGQSDGNKKEAHYRYGSVSVVLARRRQLSNKRKQMADIMLALGAFGILCMIIDTELCIQFDSYDKDGAGSKFIKSLITISTLALIFFTFRYHQIECKIYLLENGLEDWRLFYNNRKLLKLIVEFFILAIHPLPGNYDYRVVDAGADDADGDDDSDGGNTTTITTPSVTAVATAKNLIIEGERVPIDAMLSVPMFLRVFLIFRFIKLHSRIFENVACHSLGALNRVRIDFQFIFKANMQQSPGYWLTLIITGLFLLLSWSVRACEMYHDEKSNLDDFRDAMWLIAITFLTVGYGDITPVSYCGRTISVLTGMCGAACTALIVAVLTQKLELSREEKYLHAFVTDVEIGKKLKASAACVIQNAWRAFTCRKSLAPDGHVLMLERKVLSYSNRMNRLKEDRRALAGGPPTLEELYQAHQSMHIAVEKTEVKTKEIDLKLKGIENQIGYLHEKIDTLLNIRLK